MILGIPEEELLRQQEAMFAQARVEQAQEEWLQMQQTLQQQASMNQIQPGVPSTNLQPTTGPLEGQASVQNSIATSVIQEPVHKTKQEHVAPTEPATNSKT